MPRKLSPKNISLALVPAVAGMGFIGLTAQAAGAANLDNSENITFVDNEGSTFHCVLEWNQDYDPSSNSLDVIVGANPINTSTDTGCWIDSAGLNSDIRTDTLFSQNSDGTQVEHVSDGRAFSEVDYSNVKNAKITTNYSIQFQDCNSGLSQCRYTFSLSQGK